MRRDGKPDIFVARRYGDFAKFHKRLRTEFPGKPLPPLPRKNKSSTTTSWFGSADDEASSVSSVSTVGVAVADDSTSSRNLAPGNHHQRRDHNGREHGRPPVEPHAIPRLTRYETLLGYCNTWLSPAESTPRCSRVANEERVVGSNAAKACRGEGLGNTVSPGGA